MFNRAEARINLNAIAANVRHLKELSGTNLLAVVKADAYGHGLVEVAQVAISAGATWLGVALLEEAITLRKAGITAPILAWLVPPGSDFNMAVKNNIDIAISSIVAFEEISKISGRPRIHIEIDTGMTRGGFLDQWQKFLQSDFSTVEVVGLFSHFARADEPDEKQNSRQRERFLEMFAELEAVGVHPQIRHLSNSAATLKDHSSAFDLVRTGISMYGLTPDISMGDSAALGLQPVMKLRARLHLVKHVRANSPVGYGASEMTKVDTKLGVVAMGYADGIPRIAHDSGVFIDGKRAPIIGRVSMDQFVVDLGADSSAQSGDWVIIFGDGSEGEYTADDWGKASGSINYEIVTRIGVRVPRIYDYE
jgi:alanine racemase